VENIHKVGIIWGQAAVSMLPLEVWTSWVKTCKEKGAISKEWNNPKKQFIKVGTGQSQSMISNSAFILSMCL
jgi:hypothetical protein